MKPSPPGLRATHTLDTPPPPPPPPVAAELYALAGWALERDLGLDDLQVTRATLEDVYLQLTAETPRSRREQTMIWLLKLIARKLQQLTANRKKNS